MSFSIPEGQVAQLEKPLFIWDGDCGFCKYWVIRWRLITADKVQYAPYQDVSDQFPAISTREFRRAAFLIEPNGQGYRGMESAFRTFTYGSRWHFLYKWYNKHRMFQKLSDQLYNWIARNRSLLFTITRLLFGKDPAKMKPYWLFYLSGFIILIYFIFTVL